MKEIRKIIRDVLTEEEDNYASFKGVEKYYKRKEDFIKSVKTFNDIDREKIPEIIEFFGNEGFNDKEEAIKDLTEKIEEYQKFKDPVKLYRIVGVKDKKLINTDDLGEHYTPYDWMLDSDMVLSIGSEMWEENWEPYVMEVLAPLSEIDVWQTIIQNLSFPNEHEINLKNKGNGAKFIKAYKL